MAPRFSRARLIDTSDTQYRSFVRQIMIGKDNQRATRLPLPRELFGGEAEAALRDWLAQHFTLSERRIVEYLEHRGRSAIKKYRELDAVVLSDQKTVEVFEIKASQKAGYGGRYFSVDFDRTDHARVAEAFGVKAWRVEDPSDVHGAIKAALAHDGPALVDVISQPLQDTAVPVSQWMG